MISSSFRNTVRLWTTQNSSEVLKIWKVFADVSISLTPLPPRQQSSAFGNSPSPLGCWRNMWTLPLSTSVKCALLAGHVSRYWHNNCWQVVEGRTGSTNSDRSSSEFESRSLNSKLVWRTPTDVCRTPTYVHRSFGVRRRSTNSDEPISNVRRSPNSKRIRRNSNWLLNYSHPSIYQAFRGKQKWPGKSRAPVSCRYLTFLQC